MWSTACNEIVFLTSQTTNLWQHFVETVVTWPSTANQMLCCWCSPQTTTKRGGASGYMPSHVTQMGCPMVKKFWNFLLTLPNCVIGFFIGQLVNLTIFLLNQTVLYNWKNILFCNGTASRRLTLYCLFVVCCLLLSALFNNFFLLIYIRQHYRQRALNFDLCSTVTFIEQLGFFSVLYLLLHGILVLWSHLNVP